MIGHRGRMSAIRGPGGNPAIPMGYRRKWEDREDREDKSDLRMTRARTRGMGPLVVGSVKFKKPHTYPPYPPYPPKEAQKGNEKKGLAVGRLALPSSLTGGLSSLSSHTKTACCG